MARIVRPILFFSILFCLLVLFLMGIVVVFSFMMNDENGHSNNTACNEHSVQTKCCLQLECESDCCDFFLYLLNRHRFVSLKRNRLRLFCRLVPVMQGHHTRWNISDISIICVRFSFLRLSSIVRFLQTPVKLSPCRVSFVHDTL